jgi:anthranilate synthase component I
MRASDAERAALRREVVQALAGGVPFRRAGRHAARRASMSEAGFLDAVAKAKGNITAGDVFQLVLSIRFLTAAATCRLSRPTGRCGC